MGREGDGEGGREGEKETGRKKEKRCMSSLASRRSWGRTTARETRHISQLPSVHLQTVMLYLVSRPTDSSSLPLQLKSTLETPTECAPCRTDSVCLVWRSHT